MHKDDSTHTILHSAKRFFSGTLLSRISGMLRDMSMAYVFGAEAAIASFMLAFRLAHLLRRLFGEGALQSAFIPEFEALRHQNETRAFQFFRNLSIAIAAGLSGLICLLVVGLGALYYWGNFSAPNQEVILLTILMLPSLIFICLYGLNASLLQCEKKYFTAGVAPVAFNLIWVGVVIGLDYYHPPHAMQILAVGVIFACFFQWLWTLPTTLGILKKALSTTAGQDFGLQLKDLFKLGRPLALGILGVGAAQINNAIDSIFARYAELEGPAYLWYSIRLQQLPLALFGIAIAGAVLPPLSRAIKALDWSRYHEFLQYALISTLTLMIPMTAMIFCMGDTGVNLIYGHGDFNHAAVLQTTRCLWAYGIGLIPMSLVLILAPAFYAQNNYKLPAQASLLTLLVNFVLNALFIFIFKWGAVSVALATSISSWINLFVMGIVLSKQHGIIFKPDFVKSLMKITLISSIAFLGTFLLRQYWQVLPIADIMNNTILNWPRNFSSQLFDLLSQLVVFGIILGGFLKYIKKLRILTNNSQKTYSNSFDN